MCGNRVLMARGKPPGARLHGQCAWSAADFDLGCASVSASDTHLPEALTRYRVRDADANACAPYHEGAGGRCGRTLAFSGTTPIRMRVSLSDLPEASRISSRGRRSTPTASPSLAQLALERGAQHLVQFALDVLYRLLVDSDAPPPSGRGLVRQRDLPS